MNKIVYTPELLFSLNRKGIFPLNTEGLNFFSQFPKSKNPYNNPLNNNFIVHSANGGNGGRKRLLPIIEPFSDDKIMFDMKELLLKVNETNKATIIDQITKLHFTPSCEDKLADMILDVTINCIFLVNIYVDIILSMESKHKNIINRINKAIIYQIYCQRKFPSENDANACETSEQKAKKWHINNAILIAELFLRNKYRPDMIINKVLTPLIDQITPDNTVNIELLTKIFPIIGPKIEIMYGMSLDGIFSRMEQISNDSRYETRLRFLIMDMIDLRKKKWNMS